ncbi:hypothetical protein [Maritalea porphyrae]|uniref:hypothetical protein n=1 Tax=Maritalea porphyrae TaxID=880732 RepID=UPI0022AE93D8|nr:hypothetical protein [Maritalea porphyrae]MCZ4270819.1 hypothetical protein [Maritalea porphyrae]
MTNEPPVPAYENPNLAWRSFKSRTPIESCRLTSADLKRLYRIFSAKQLEYLNGLESKISQIEEESVQQFNQRAQRVRDALIVTVTVTGSNGIMTTGHGEEFFESSEFPDSVDQVFFDTSFSPKALLDHDPTEQATLLLDFTRPLLLDVSNPPTAQTPNNSNYFISSTSESWARSLSSQLSEFFADRKLPTNWIHKAGAYDWLLMLLGLPLSLWGTFRAYNLFFGNLDLNSGIQIPIHIYFMFLSLYIFRGLFAYFKWMVPKMEFEGVASPGKLQRRFWYTVVLAIIAAAVYDAVQFGIMQNTALVMANKLT